MNYPKCITHFDGHIKDWIESEDRTQGLLLVQLAKDAWDKLANRNGVYACASFREKYSGKPKDWLDSDQFKEMFLSVPAGPHFDKFKEIIRKNYKVKE